MSGENIGPTRVTTQGPEYGSIAEERARKVVSYAVNNLYATIQGEGALTGTPMILLRLHNCPVGCPFCDTKYTWGEFSKHDESRTRAADPADTRQWLGENDRWTRASGDELALMCAQENGRGGGVGCKWVMLTGGEPALQNLGPLIDALHARGFSINLETSGTAAIDQGRTSIDWICCSPKIGMPGGRRLLAQPVAIAHEIKFVIGKPSDVDKMREFYREYGVLLRPDVRRSVQPMSMSEKATALCVELAKRDGYCVSIQTHKIMGLD